MRRDRDFCFPYLVFRDEIEIFAFLISFFETRSRFFLSLSRFSRRFETKSRAKSHEIFRDRDISLGSAAGTSELKEEANVCSETLKPAPRFEDSNLGVGDDVLVILGSEENSA